MIFKRAIQSTKNLINPLIKIGGVFDRSDSFLGWNPKPSISISNTQFHLNFLFKNKSSEMSLHPKSKAIHFSEIDLKIFHEKGLHSSQTKLYYFILFLFCIKNFMEYTFDIAFVVLYFTNKTSEKGFDYLQKYIYTVCVAFAMLFLIWEWIKARGLLKQDDVVFIFCNDLAVFLCSLRSFSRFVVLRELTRSRKKRERIALFVYYQLRGD